MGKQSIYEGGVRVPAFITWPGTIDPAEVDDRISVADVLPTLLEAVGVNLGPEPTRDGVSRWDVIQASAQTPPPDLITIAADGTAYYEGDWKLIEHNEVGRELYDLRSDPYESKDLSGSKPDVAGRLARKLAAFPRGEDVGLPLWRIVLDTDEFGGEERAPQMAERSAD